MGWTRVVTESIGESWRTDCRRAFHDGRMNREGRNALQHTSVGMTFRKDSRLEFYDGKEHEAEFAMCTVRSDGKRSSRGFLLISVHPSAPGQER